MAHRVHYTRDEPGTSVAADILEIVESGRWVTIRLSGDASIYSEPAHAIRFITLDFVAQGPSAVTGPTGDDLEHLIHFVEGARPDIDDRAVASEYRFRNGWLQYAELESGEDVLCPPDVVEPIELDTASIDD
ncbi:hypothetical protein [Halalkalicoccus tibetensis]|uniref:Halobacterial output domain-containing protein n=1 Tax=Halalkalicoccus tibetensis TaxID=175632 RepID=A0ABD5V6W8_9EURY